LARARRSTFSENALNCAPCPCLSRPSHRSTRRIVMWHRSTIVAIAAALAAALAMTAGDARAADDAKYPNWKGQWARFIVPGLPGQASHDQTKPQGYGQEAPLKSEYRAVLDASMADQAN